MKKLTIIFLLCSNLFASGFLKTKGNKIIDATGNEFLFRGIGLGGYLVPEGYMFKMSNFANSPSEIKAKITQLIGKSETEKFFEKFRNNFITKRDIDSLYSWGFNSIRLPIHYEFFTPQDSPFVYINKGFDIIDSLISWCKPLDMYVVLDLHAAPGGQNSGNISDYDPTQPSLWESDTNKLRTIDLWKHIAQRYKNEETIGGYELLNEPNWDLGSTNAPLRELFINITNAIREVDSTHIIFIEGNHYATDLTGLTPPWDSNMCYVFHKYWSRVTQSSISSYLSIRNNYNVPLWMSESGENSNAWFTEFISLLNEQNIGWHWWTYKKFDSISSLLSVPISPQFQQLLDYWDGKRSKPSTDFAIVALTLQAENLKIENCKINKDVLDAMMRQPYDNKLLPFNKNTIPGRIFATEYDFGKHNMAYHDEVFENNGNEVYNSGYSFRNDGVDIEKCSDAITNGYDVGWIENGDWLKFSVDVTRAGTYDIYIRIASAQSGGKIQFLLDNNILTNLIDVPLTGGWQSWQTLIYRNVTLPVGNHELMVRFFFGGFNVNFVEFKNTTKVEESSIGNLHFELTQNYPNPFNSQTIISYSLGTTSKIAIAVFNIKGELIQVLANKTQTEGRYLTKWDASNFSSGVYFLKFTAISLNGNKTYSSTKKMLLLK